MSSSFRINDLTSKIKVSRSIIRDSLIRLNDFNLINIEKIQNTGTCMSLTLINPQSTKVNPQDVVLKPKDLNIQELRQLQLNKEKELRIIQDYTSLSSSDERWRFLEEYFDGTIRFDKSQLYDSIVKNLNKQQIQAVTHPSGYLLVNAGAGTGKTETVARRILYISQELGVPSSNILGLTFSRSGVSQLRDRIKRVIPERRIDIRTYHSLTYSILNQYAGVVSALWIKPGFTVKAVDNIIYQFKQQIMNFDDGLPERDKLKLYQFAIEKIQSQRNFVFPEDIKDSDQINIEDNVIQGKNLKTIYHSYLSYLQSNNMIDFGLMISLTVQLFKLYPKILRRYQRKINFLIVDEYQDTKPIEDELLRLLGDWYGNMTVVGDNDQNIFAWNFADVYNILDFDKRYPKTKIINLVKNYRSTKTILEVANESIQYNNERIPKTLLPNRKEPGDRVKIFYTESKENIGEEYIVSEIKKIRSQGTYQLKDIAILTRTGDHQRRLIDKLKAEGIPINSSQRDIDVLNSKPIRKLLTEMLHITKKNPDLSAYNCYTEAMNNITLDKIPHTFSDMIREFEETADDNSAQSFIQYTQSVSKNDFTENTDDAVHVLTIHSSKGLEFKVVFVTYLRKYSFPHMKSDIEEERRLFYVSLTRAMDSLYLIGSSTETSPFIQEVQNLLSVSDI